VRQAEALRGILAQHALKLDAVLDYELPRDQVLRRLSGRRLCSKCGISYHMESRRPKVTGFCDNCDAPVIQRDDDREAAVMVRLETYARQTAPLIDFYRREGVLVTVHCGETPDVTFARSLEGLAKSVGT
jgi:adenylate kinase